MGEPGPAPGVPGEGEVRVWWLDLAHRLPPSPSLLGVLAPAEVERAGRFRFERDRVRYVRARGALRCLLGAYAGVAPGSLRLGHGPFGKPRLEAPDAGLHFNLAHADDLMVVALTGAGEVGVDVEAVRPLPDLERIAEHFFSAGEREALGALPPARREDAFFACWTRKEAYLKALGSGLAVPLDAFEVCLAPEEPPRIRTVDGDAAEAARWTLLDLECEPGYRAALAIRAPVSAVESRRVPPVLHGVEIA